MARKKTSQKQTNQPQTTAEVTENETQTNVNNSVVNENDTGNAGDTEQQSDKSEDSGVVLKNQCKNPLELPTGITIVPGSSVRVESMKGIKGNPAVEAWLKAGALVVE